MPVFFHPGTREIPFALLLLPPHVSIHFTGGNLLRGDGYEIMLCHERVCWCWCLCIHGYQLACRLAGGWLVGWLVQVEWLVGWFAFSNLNDMSGTLEYNQLEKPVRTKSCVLFRSLKYSRSHSYRMECLIQLAKWRLLSCPHYEFTNQQTPSMFAFIMLSEL